MNHSFPIIMIQCQDDSSIPNYNDSLNTKTIQTYLIHMILYEDESRIPNYNNCKPERLTVHWLYEEDGMCGLTVPFWGKPAGAMGAWLLPPPLSS